MLDLIIILLNNSIALLMKTMEEKFVKLEIRIKDRKKEIEENFNYNFYQQFKREVEANIRNIDEIEHNLNILRKTLNILEITIQVQNVIINVLLFIPILPPKLIDMLINLKEIISSAARLIRIVSNLINFILRKLDRIKALLQELLNIQNKKLIEIITLYNDINTFKTIDGVNGLVPNITANSTSIGITSIVVNTNNNTTIFQDNGYNFTYQQVQAIVLELQDYTIPDDRPELDIEYKGYTFKIIELDSTVPNVKKRYVIALDENGIERFKSETSFTLRPTVLIESLKYKIDNFLIESFTYEI